MKKITFTKMVASGNDFVVVGSFNHILPAGRRLTVNSLRKSVIKICDRKFGVGADGVLFLEKSKIADIRMRIFNADGSEAEMCGNGARCTAYYMSFGRLRGHRSEGIKIETKAGIIKAIVNGDNVKIRLTDPKNTRLDVPIVVNNRKIKVNFINTGVPHTVIFSQGLDSIDVGNIAPFIRYHKEFAPKGTNVDFIEAIDGNSFKIRTYERGVEDETLACGTGSVASALIFSLKNGSKGPINVHTKSGEVLKVYFTRDALGFNDVWLQGKARVVFQGNLAE